MYQKKNLGNFQKADQAIDEALAEKRGAPAEAPPAAATPPPDRKTDRDSIKIHNTVPIDQSLAKHKKRHKPRKEKTDTEVLQNGKTENQLDRRPSPDAGNKRRSAWGIVLPVDWFRRSDDGSPSGGGDK